METDDDADSIIHDGQTIVRGIVLTPNGCIMVFHPQQSVRLDLMVRQLQLEPIRLNFLGLDPPTGQTPTSDAHASRARSASTAAASPADEQQLMLRLFENMGFTSHDSQQALEATNSGSVNDAINVALDWIAENIRIGRRPDIPLVGTVSVGEAKFELNIYPA
jgi:hypothetical protein